MQQANTPSWRRTPPAIFPPILGLLGLGMGWRVLGRSNDIAAGLAEIILGMAALLLIVGGALYLAKIAARPSVLLDELRVLPARAAVAAGTMSIMLFGAVLAPYDPAVGKWVLYVGLTLHLILALAVLRTLATLPPEAPKWGPVLHLPFVGAIVGGVSAAGQGLDGLAEAILYATMVTSAVVYALSLPAAIKGQVPAPLRPPLAIHLAPVTLFGLVAVGLGKDQLAMGLLAVSTLVFIALLARGRWITQAGFSPLWGSFTFPLAAFASLNLQIWAAGLSQFSWMVGGGLLVVATVAIPWIAARIMQGWIKGKLSAQTNAATA